jgi:hypothetical protein
MTMPLPALGPLWFAGVAEGERATLTGIGLPGRVITDADLMTLGFVSHELVFGKAVAWGSGCGIEWKTVGDLPQSAGNYAFTILRVTYVGLTEHLWMVTKGFLPAGGGARPGQRYGKPKYSGVTRKRINYLVWCEAARGHHPQHWLRPLDVDQIRPAEMALIARWNLTRIGWNRQS